MLKHESSPEYTFGVKNIKKSELRPLHKFEQDLHVDVPGATSNIQRYVSVGLLVVDVGYAVLHCRFLLRYEQARATL